MDKSVDQLLEDLKSTSDDVRKRAVLVLAKHAEPRVFKALEDLSNDSSTAVRYFAKKALRDFEATSQTPPVAAPEGVTFDGDVPVTGQAVIKKSEVIPEKDSISILLKNLKSGDLKLQLETIKKFGENREVMAIDPLLEMINHEVRDLRIYAVQSLGLIGEQRVLTPLLNLLNSEPDAFVKATLVKGIARVGGVQLIPILARYLKDPDGRTRANTVESLEIIGDPKIIKFLVPLLQDPSSRVKANAVKVLSKFGKSNMLEHLEEMLKSDDDNVRGSAIFALNKIGGDGVVGILAGALQDSRTENVLIAIEGLQKIGSDEAHNILKKLENNPDPQIQAALSGEELESGVPPLEPELEITLDTKEVQAEKPSIPVAIPTPKPVETSQIASSIPVKENADFQTMWMELNSTLQHYQTRYPNCSRKDMAKMLRVVVDAISE
jgi:HEAT repeat protein